MDRNERIKIGLKNVPVPVPDPLPYDLETNSELESEGKNSEDKVLGPRYLDKWDDAVSRVSCHLGRLLQPVCGVNVIIVEVKGGNREI